MRVEVVHSGDLMRQVEPSDSDGCANSRWRLTVDDRKLDPRNLNHETQRRCVRDCVGCADEDHLYVAYRRHILRL